MTAKHPTPPSIPGNDGYPPDDTAQAASSVQPEDPAQLTSNFTHLAAQASRKSQEAADAAQEALRSATKLAKQSREAAQSPPFTTGQTSVDITARQQHTKADALLAQAWSFAPLARKAADLAASFAEQASSAASQAVLATDLMPGQQGRRDLWESATAALVQADEAAGHARRAKTAFETIMQDQLQGQLKD